MNQLGAAQRDLLRSIELGRDDLVALTSLGETLARMGRRDEAERYFAGLLARDPSSLVVRVARGFTRIAADPAGAQAISGWPSTRTRATPMPTMAWRF